MDSWRSGPPSRLPSSSGRTTLGTTTGGTTERGSRRSGDTRPSTFGWGPKDTGIEWQ
jgi:hypothetical protein